MTHNDTGVCLAKAPGKLIPRTVGNGKYHSEPLTDELVLCGGRILFQLCCKQHVIELQLSLITFKANEFKPKMKKMQQNKFVGRTQYPKLDLETLKYSV